MKSTLSPREIQTRIRAGESLDEVAQAAGVPAEKIEPFAAPIIAERNHVAGVALTSPLRQANQSSGHRTLRVVTNEYLLKAGVASEDVEWDAWREADRKWIISAMFQTQDKVRIAEFRYDQMGRFSVAANEDALWLTGELREKQTPPRLHDPDYEQTIDFTDEFAIVRAVGAEAPNPPVIDKFPEVSFNPIEDIDADDLGEPELTQVNGIYDIVPGQGELDNLYDMFGSYTEDSVEIYPGLGEVHAVGQSLIPDSPQKITAEPVQTTLEEILITDAETEAASDSELVVANPVVSEPIETEVSNDTDEVISSESELGLAEPTVAITQDSDDSTQTENTTVISRNKKIAKKKRASVPSWDEIMFGGNGKE
ncbi:MAG: septation protein SepH [Propionibacteriaceae bacterium]